MTLHHFISYYFLSFPLISLASFSAALVYFLKKSRPIKNVVVSLYGMGTGVRYGIYLFIYILFTIYYLLLNNFNLLPHIKYTIYIHTIITTQL